MDYNFLYNNKNIILNKKNTYNNHKNILNILKLNNLNFYKLLIEDFFNLFLNFKFISLIFFKLKYFFKKLKYKLTYTEYYNYTILFLDFINHKKLIRILYGLPLNGQSAWSNGWSVYKSNKLYINFKKNNYIKIYKNKNFKNWNKLIIASYVNKLWFINWTNEWFKLYCLYLNKKKKKYSKGVKVNIDLLSKFEVTNINKVIKKKKKKKIQYATIGIPLNIIKLFIKKTKIKKWIILMNVVEKKKKILVKKKKIIKKKKKKSLWD